MTTLEELQNELNTLLNSKREFTTNPNDPFFTTQQNSAAFTAQIEADKFRIIQLENLIQNFDSIESSTPTENNNATSLLIPLILLGVLML